MGVNKYRKHVLVMPEDEADRELANGFIIDPAINNCIDVRPPSGGWPKLLDGEIVKTLKLERYPDRHVVLLIDFDEKFNNRKKKFKNEFPNSDANAKRVYLLGTRNKPEKLKANVGKSFESIGRELARACAEDIDGLWGHEFLKHNADELNRLKSSVKPFLFR